MDVNSMEQLRRAARDAIQERHSELRESSLANVAVPDSLVPLWDHISSQNDASNIERCEALLFALGFLSIWGPRTLANGDKIAVNNLYDWASNSALPSPVFTETQKLTDEQRHLIEEDKLRSAIAISVISSLAVLLPICDAASAPDVVIALASFTSESDPWTSPRTHTCSAALLETYVDAVHSNSDSIFWSTVEEILKQKIRPLFAKTRNPAITATGRKDFHPVPLPRFDTSVLDLETKPWKFQDVYATTVLSWIISQYRATDRVHLEEHFPLLVPAILTLIDDDSLPFKTRGCNLVSRLLIPIQDSKSDILRRTNLSSVFEDAIRPCLLSLPTITPEDDSISLLSAAYPALLSILKTNAQNSFTIPPQISKELYISRITKTLRENLIPSFHHISSTNTTFSSASFSSFPYPRLSTVLLNHMSHILLDLGIHTTKYLQEIIPLLYSTLSNPFGTAHPPLLLGAISLIRAVIMNAHPRLWRWRGEILGAFCACWLHVIDEEGEIADRKRRNKASDSDEASAVTMGKLKRELKGASYLLKFALQNPAQAATAAATPTTTTHDPGQLDAKENIEKELQMLIEADSVLEDLFTVDFDTTDVAYFGSS
ncbi:hypothetical protein EYZ11_000560 [Aspergillus tanneri]|uniref:Uncharacterized protein n=1 Tax=Aspergillus tanneri TaxID=1220188 RepID=A0A4S3JWV6_9EURO|nr:hypothetical protein EYZ11_000560 [Aspergillus tanneri]